MFLKRSPYLLAFASAAECALCAAAGAADRVVCPMSGSDASLPCRTLLAGSSSLELYPLLGLDAPLLVGMLDHPHLGDKVGVIDQLLGGMPAGDDDVQRIGTPF